MHADRRNEEITNERNNYVPKESKHEITQKERKG